MRDELDWRDKAVPPSAYGMTLEEWIATRPRLAELGTPMLTIDAESLQHNIETMAEWCAEHGLLHAPHGKTTMAPELWHWQLEAGAHAITLANARQLYVARGAGIPRVFLANELLDPVALRWAADWVAEGAELVCWADSTAGVSIMDDALSGAAAPLDVCVELGIAGGRAGARSIAEAREVAGAVRAARNLRLVGVTAWEGGLDDLATVDELLRSLVALHESLTYETDAPIVTAGGSAYFDEVANHLAPLASGGARPVLRAGAYITHDDVHYAELTPAARGADGPELLPALRAHARVLSMPEPGLAILDAGRRDVPYDLDLPVPLDLPGATVTAVNDQHAFLTGDLGGLRVGDVLRLGLSHPCTAFDKWNLIPVIDADERVVHAFRTYF